MELIGKKRIDKGPPEHLSPDRRHTRRLVGADHIKRGRREAIPPVGQTLHDGKSAVGGVMCRLKLLDRPLKKPHQEEAESQAVRYDDDSAVLVEVVAPQRSCNMSGHVSKYHKHTTTLPRPQKHACVLHSQLASISAD
jgi:hypothetical protein